MQDDRSCRDEGDDQPSAVYEWTRGSATKPEQAPNGGEDQQWTELLARYDLLQAAARLAWEALLEAYKPSADGFVDRPPELLERYQQASALRQAAEFALYRHILTGGRKSSPE
jgi:hypothetical protein